MATKALFRLFFWRTLRRRSGVSIHARDRRLARALGRCRSPRADQAGTGSASLARRSQHSASARGVNSCERSSARSRPGRWRGLNVPLDEVRRLAHPELAPVIRELWGEGPANEDVRELLIEMIWQGPVEGCADLAHAAAFDIGWSALSPHRRRPGPHCLRLGGRPAWRCGGHGGSAGGLA